MVTMRGIAQAVTAGAIGAAAALAVIVAADDGQAIGWPGASSLTVCDGSTFPCIDPAGADLSMIGEDDVMHHGCSVILTGPATSRLSCTDGYEGPEQ